MPPPFLCVPPLGPIGGASAEKVVVLLMEAGWRNAGIEIYGPRRAGKLPGGDRSAAVLASGCVFSALVKANKKKLHARKHHSGLGKGLGLETRDAEEACLQRGSFPTPRCAHTHPYTNERCCSVYCSFCFLQSTPPPGDRAMQALALAQTPWSHICNYRQPKEPRDYRVPWYHPAKHARTTM